MLRVWNIFPIHLVDVYGKCIYLGVPRPNKVAGLWDDSCKGFLTTNGQSLVFGPLRYGIGKYAMHGLFGIDLTFL